MSTAPASRPRRAIPISPTIPAAVSSAAAAMPSAANRPATWAEVKAYLAKRTSIAPTQANSWLWCLPATWDRAACTKLVELVSHGAVSALRQKQLRERLTAWLGREQHDARGAWEALVWLAALPALATLLDDATGEQLLNRVQSTIDSTSENLADPLAFQLIAVELRAALAGVLPRSPQTNELLEQAQRSLARLADEWLDGEGLPEGRYVPLLPAMLASWTRAFARHGDDLFNHDLGEHFLWLLRHTIRGVRGDGFTFTAGRGDATLPDCLATAVEISGDSQAAALFQSLVNKNAKPGRATKGAVALSPSVYSEWGQVAILRSGLRRESPQLAVAFDEQDCQLEIVAESPLLSGEWLAELVVDGETLIPTRAWEEVCWHEDDDAVYLEIETVLSDRWRLQRHVLLARQEGFALIADAVLGEQVGNLRYTTSVPLYPGLELQPEAQTNEAWLVQGKRRHLTLPLALPEWRSDRRLGELSLLEGRLTLTSERRGRNLFVPLLIPLVNLRGKAEYTWRQLTVAQQLEIQSPDAAAAYRVQLGDRQWAFYRALSERGNRTFLGRNLTTEFLAAVFHRSGKFDAILEIE